MIIYIIVPLMIVIYGGFLFYKGITKRKKIIFLCISFFTLWMIMGMRNIQVGNDTRAYYTYFLKWGSYQAQIGGATQPIYYLYNRIIYRIIQYGQGIIICNSLLEVIGIAIFIYYFSENVFLSTYLWITLYFFCESMNIARQFLGLSFFLIAYVLLWKKNNIIFSTIFIILAIGTHSLIASLLPILLFKFIKLTKNRIYLIIVGGTVFTLFFDRILEILIKIFCTIFPYYRQYLGSGRFNVYNEGGSRNVLLVIFYLVFVGISILLIKNDKVGEEKKRNLIILLVPCIITIVIGLGAVNIISVQRIKVLYSTFFICFIPNVIACYDKKSRVILNVVIMLITLLPYSIQLIGNYGGVIPYNPFWR